MRLRARIVLFLCAFAWAGPAIAAAAQTVPPTCDPEVKGVIDARAWMGGKRDMESAQTILDRRPTDSILDISCFDGHVSHLGTAADNLFSDNVTSTDLFQMPPWFFVPLDQYQPTFQSPFGPQPPGGPFTNLKLDNVLNALVRQALHDYLGDIFYKQNLVDPPAIICSVMSDVWETSKCTDFNKDWSITLSQHMSLDRRGCSPLTRLVWRQRFEEANPLPVPRHPAAEPQPPGGLDQMLSYIGNIYPQACTSIRPVPTGLIFRKPMPVQDGNGNQAVDQNGQLMWQTIMVDDAICPGVSCWYNYENNTCN